MIITVSGLTGCGKNTLGEQLAKELGYKMVCPTFKDLAEKEGISLMEFQKKAEKDHNIDKKFDAVLKEQAKGNCVVTTWLGPWMLNADVRVRLFAPLSVRAQRIAKRDGMSAKEAEQHVKERDLRNQKRYKKVYGIDIFDDESFDITINSGKHSQEETFRIALAAIKAIGRR